MCTDASILHQLGTKGGRRMVPPKKKLTLALVIIACKLRPCFQAHTIVVHMDKTLRKIRNYLEAAE